MSTDTTAPTLTRRLRDLPIDTEAEAESAFRDLHALRLAARAAVESARAVHEHREAASAEGDQDAWLLALRQKEARGLETLHALLGLLDNPRPQRGDRLPAAEVVPWLLAGVISEGAYSEGDIAHALGLDRIDVRRLAQEGRAVRERRIDERVARVRAEVGRPEETAEERTERRERMAADASFRGQRLGQALFNALARMGEEFAEEIRGTGDDPFHDDSRFLATLTLWRQSIEERSAVTIADLRESLKQATDEAARERSSRDDTIQSLRAEALYLRRGIVRAMRIADPETGRWLDPLDDEEPVGVEELEEAVKLLAESRDEERTEVERLRVELELAEARSLRGDRA